MKDRKQIIDELNREEKYPAFLRRSVGLKNMLVGLMLIGLTVILLVIAVIAKRWVDQHGQAIGLLFMVLGALSFSYWALWGRKK